MDNTLSTISAMLHQEETGYATSDYLSQQQVPLHLCAVDVDCRDKMAAWCYQVVDFCKFNRETVSIAMNYLDRYLMTAPSAMYDRKVFQLAAMTCLYTAVKVHEPEAMDPQLVAKLSRGTYTPREVERMESDILTRLQWRVNMPTALSFVRLFLELVPSEVLDQDLKDAAYDLTKCQTELAVNDYGLITTKASVVAYCSLLNSFGSLGLSNEDISCTIATLEAALNISTADASIANVQDRLFEAIVSQEPATMVHKESTPSRTRKPTRRGSVETSPRAVSA